MITWIGLFLAWQATPHVISAETVEPEGVRGDQGLVTFSDPILGWTCRIQALDRETFLDRLAGLGIPESLLTGSSFLANLSDMLFFEIDWINDGNADLTFNIDQILLRGGNLSAGSMLDVAHLWPGASPSGKPSFGQEYVAANEAEGLAYKKLAAIFSQGSLTIAGGDNAARLVAFSPTQRRFPRRVNMLIDRVYYGSEPFRLEARFKVRYRR